MITATYQRGMDLLAQKVDEEILAGLKCGQDIRDAARIALDYYELRGIQYVSRRDNESGIEYERRPKRSLPLTRRVVDLLCSHLYSPGPSRHFEDDGIGEWWEKIAEHNLINSLWQRATVYSTLHGVAMYQAAQTGDPENPVKIHIWTRDQFEVFTLPDDSMTVAHVVTVEQVDEQTIYKWWSADKIRTYRSKKLGLYQTTGGRVAEFVSEEDNVYGMLPFSFVHHDLPVRCWHTPGIGNYLAEINGTIDDEASDMASAVRAYHTPLPVLYEATAEQQVIKKFGAFIRVNSDAGDMEGASPRLEYLQANLDITGGWDNIRSAILTVLEGLGIPETAYRLNQATLPSGAAQVAEQAPLMTYSQNRQEPFRKYERDLVSLCAAVDLGYTEDVGLSLKWPPTSISLPGADRDQQDQDALTMGIESLVMVVMRRFGLDEDEAKEHIQRVAEDNAFVRSLNVLPQQADPNAPQQVDTALTSDNTGEVAESTAPDDTSY